MYQNNDILEIFWNSINYNGSYKIEIFNETSLIHRSTINNTYFMFSLYGQDYGTYTIYVKNNESTIMDFYNYIYFSTIGTSCF